MDSMLALAQNRIELLQGWDIPSQRKEVGKRSGRVLGVRLARALQRQKRRLLSDVQVSHPSLSSE